MSEISESVDSSAVAPKPAAWQWVASAVLISLITALGTTRDFYYSSMASPFLSVALLSACVILMVLRRSSTDLLLASAGASLLGGYDVGILRFPNGAASWFSFLGMSSFAVLGLRAVWAENREARKVLIAAFLPAALFVGSDYMASTLLDVTEKLHPKVLDLYLLSFDFSLRYPISFATGKLLLTWPALHSVCMLFYIGLPLPLALVFAAKLRHGVKHAMPVMLAFLITGPAGVFFYNLIPGIGPMHLLGAMFPLHPPPIHDIMRLKLESVLMPPGPRNAIPSLHMAWVLLVWWASRGLASWIRAVALAFVGFTILATMGIGEHHFVDLVVAFPFALMVLAGCSYTVPLANAKRLAALLWGTLAMATWFTMLCFAGKFFWISAMIPWTFVVATVGVTVLLEARMQSALEMKVPDLVSAVAPPVELPPKEMAHHA
jgi:hypothetical protein